jgi:hypothetical protein
MQNTLIAGDTLSTTVSLAAYPASQGYALTLRLIRRDANTAAIEVAAVASGDDHVLTATAATTAGWAAGTYTWVQYVTKAAERYTVASGELRIKADPASAAAPYDDRSHARKVLAAIEAVIENRATSEEQEMSLQGRQLKFIPIADLLVLRDRYLTEVRAEEAADRLTSGRRPRNRLFVRFTR